MSNVRRASLSDLLKPNPVHDSATDAVNELVGHLADMAEDMGGPFNRDDMHIRLVLALRMSRSLSTLIKRKP